MQPGFGAFGKIPALGDFLRVNLPAGFVQRWDSWLQSALVAARQALGPRWEACYMSAPIWRFSLPAGQAGDQGFSGILMPSVDRVGRQYPLTLAAPCPPGDAALRHFANTAVFARLEDIALDVLEHETGLADLQQALGGIALTHPGALPPATEAYAGALPPDQVMAARQIAQTRGQPAVWTSIGDGEQRMMLCAGLPDTREVTALFDPGSALWPQRPVARQA